MLRGDLQTTPLIDLLRNLAGASATGCVYLLPTGERFDAEEATITLRDGAICGVTLPGTGDALGTRLVATHQLTPDDLAEAKLAQETELASWMLADLLIHLGMADEHHLQAVAAEQALSDLTQICTWKSGTWRFRRRARLGRNLPSPLPVEEALATVVLRAEQWRRLLPTILGADAIVSLAPNDPDASDEPSSADNAVEMESEAFVLLCTVDGTRTIDELAKVSGFTLLDAGLLTAALISAGLVAVSRDPSKPPLPGDEPEAEVSDKALEQAAGTETDDELAGLTATASFEADGPLLPENIAYGFSPVGPEWEPPSWQQTDRLADALARVSAALSEAMVEPAGEPTVEPTDIEALEVLAADDAAGEAFLDAIEEPYDDACLEAIEAATIHAVPEPELDEKPEPELELEPENELEPEMEPEPVAIAEPEPSRRPSGRSLESAEASRMLSQFAGETAAESAPDEDEDEADPVAEQHPAPAGSAPTPRRQTGPADTAALLRELSSLGADNGGANGGGPIRSNPIRPAAGSPAGPPSQQRKRKGLFGRS